MNACSGKLEIAWNMGEHETTEHQAPLRSLGPDEIKILLKQGEDGAPMWLTRIEPDGPGSEQRTFECQGIDVVKCR